MPVLGGGLFVDDGPRNRLKPARVASLLSSRAPPPYYFSSTLPILYIAQRRGTAVQVRHQIGRDCTAR